MAPLQRTSPLRVGINARLLYGPSLRGFNRYTAELARALAATGRVEPILFSERPIHPVHDLSHLRSVVASVRPTARWQHVWLSGALRRERIDVFHAPAQWGIPWMSPCPAVATIHDVVGFELPHLLPRGSSWGRFRNAVEQALVTRRAQRIITVSEWSAASIRRHVRLPSDRLRVTVEGAAPAFLEPQAPERIAAVRAARGLPERYFLYVGGFDERKNLGALVAALAVLAPRQRVAIGLVGAPDAGADRLWAQARQMEVRDWLIPVGAVEDCELAALYAGAVALVMPSWLEGFGLPVVEAMHVGTPSLVSEGGSLPEIAGDACLRFAPGDAPALAAAMATVCADPGLRARLAAAAVRRAALYTWSAAAEQTIAVYEEVVGRSLSGSAA